MVAGQCQLIVLFRDERNLQLIVFTSCRRRVPPQPACSLWSLMAVFLLFKRLFGLDRAFLQMQKTNISNQVTQYVNVR